MSTSKIDYRYEIGFPETQTVATWERTEVRTAWVKAINEGAAR